MSEPTFAVVYNVHNGFNSTAKRQETIYTRNSRTLSCATTVQLFTDTDTEQYTVCVCIHNVNIHSVPTVN